MSSHPRLDCLVRLLGMGDRRAALLSCNCLAPLEADCEMLENFLSRADRCARVLYTHSATPDAFPMPTTPVPYSQFTVQHIQLYQCISYHQHICVHPGARSYPLTGVALCARLHAGRSHLPQTHILLLKLATRQR